jgi:co-chaperonin GroES (HSP10)
MSIKPTGKNIIIKCSVDKIGNFDVSSKATAKESGEIIAIGDEAKGFEVGQTILFKAWDISIIEYEGEKYNFIQCDSPAICGVNV